jgi:hypothetical protein
MTAFTPGVKNLALVLEAGRKQEEYATKRFAYTEICLRDFRDRQRELGRVRARLIGLLYSRSSHKV